MRAFCTDDGFINYVCADRRRHNSGPAAEASADSCVPHSKMLFGAKLWWCRDLMCRDAVLCCAALGRAVLWCAKLTL